MEIGVRMRRKLDLMGRRFGRLIVLGSTDKRYYGQIIWFCKCDCGNYKEIPSGNLIGGSTRSCGCLIGVHNKKDITDQRFGKLVVIKVAGKASDGSYTWLCKCDCGNIVEANGCSLRANVKRSCGCLCKFPKGEANFNFLYRGYKDRCLGSDRGLEWGLTREQFRKFTKSNCHYCGIEPKQVINEKGSNGSYTYNGIDRKDSSKGYTMDNSVSCCGRCNFSKGARSVKEFYTWIAQIYKYCIVGEKK